MFTGLVEDVGRVTAVEVTTAGAAGARRIAIATPLADEEMPLGASLAVDGTCLTITHWKRGQVAAVAAAETLARTTLGRLQPGDAVNLERPLRLGDRLGGHLVAGHVDGVGTIAEKRPRGEAVDLTVACAPELLRYIVEKGSICVDGISLTVNAVDERGFAVSLIPHTQGVTTLSRKNVSIEVNLEVDIIGKYVEKLLGAYTGASGESGITLEKLKEHGFV